MTILGYRENLKQKDNGEYDWGDHSRSYQFHLIRPTEPGMIVTAAMMMCADCGTVIKSMGGPGRRCYCIKCYEALKVSDFSQGFTHEIIG